MLSSLVPLLVVGVVCWMVLPTVVLVAAAFGSRRQPVNPVWVRRCRGSLDDGEVCWVPADAAYCPRHESHRAWPEGSGQEIFIA